MSEFSLLCTGRENYHYALFRLQLKQRYELVTSLLTTIFRKFWKQRDCLWIEIPIERNPSLGDKTLHSEILISRKNEVATIIKGMPHIEKILATINPANSLHWDTKQTLQVLGENQESIENLFYDDRISSSLMAN